MHEMELGKVLAKLKEANENAKVSIAWETLQTIIARCKLLENAWSQSWLGYHAYTYYESFERPPIGKPFSKRMPIINMKYRCNDSSWITYRPDAVDTFIYNGLDRSEIESSVSTAEELEESFIAYRRNVLRLIEVKNARSLSTPLDELLDEIQSLKIQSANERIDSAKQTITHDSWDTDPHLEHVINVPIHKQALAKSLWIQNVIESLQSMARLVEEFMSLEELSNSNEIATRALGNKIFIGHGGSLIWLELRRFLQEELDLQVLEFKEESPAGSAILGRVLSLVEQASFAFLVMTGEDKVIDEKENVLMHPRLNVVHELGICQSQLGHMKAIALVEKGCVIPSNITGINHISFEKGKILSASQDIRDVLKREMRKE